MRTKPVERSAAAAAVGPTTLAFPARPSHPPRLALLVAYLFYNIANQDGCANIIATGTQRILTQTVERRRERERAGSSSCCLVCISAALQRNTLTLPTPHSPLPTPAQCARGSITLLAQFRGWLAPSPRPLPSRIEPFVVVYLFCKQFQHFVHSASPSLPLPFSPQCIILHTECERGMPTHTYTRDTLHNGVACTCVVLMSFSICSMIRKQIDSHSISRRATISIFIGFLCTPISAILLSVPLPPSPCLCPWENIIKL